MRSGWLRPGSARDRRQRFRLSALVRVLAAEMKSVARREVRASARANPPYLARTYAHHQVAEPRQMCRLPCVAEMITPALEFAGRDN
jgi:hypothetical protein